MVSFEHYKFTSLYLFHQKSCKNKTEGKILLFDYIEKIIYLLYTWLSMEYSKQSE
jgi:hypothetical protein